mmetsp:Transcript_37593/g.62494  ORF Transcript_37593/g.62494 Transcript_37593/m.62494 type:complete len:264 (+) Transcript_37593:2081-2872(+)
MKPLPICYFNDSDSYADENSDDWPCTRQTHGTKQQHGPTGSRQAGPRSVNEIRQDCSAHAYARTHAIGRRPAHHRRQTNRTADRSNMWTRVGHDCRAVTQPWQKIRVSISMQSAICWSISCFLLYRHAQCLYKVLLRTSRIGCQYRHGCQCITQVPKPSLVFLAEDTSLARKSSGKCHAEKASHVELVKMYPRESIQARVKQPQSTKTSAEDWISFWMFRTLGSKPVGSSPALPQTDPSGIHGCWCWIFADDLRPKPALQKIK